MLCEAIRLAKGGKEAVSFTVTKMSLHDLNEIKLEKLQGTVANKISIGKKKDFEKLDELNMPWYPKDEKFHNGKLGTLYDCKF